MKDTLHILMASEDGKTRNYVVSKKAIKKTAFLAAALFLALAVMSSVGVSLSYKGISQQKKLSGLEMQLAEERSRTEGLQGKVIALGQEKEDLLRDAVGELNEKSQIIESILSTVGIDVKVQETHENSGGPFTSLTKNNHEDLIFMADRYLATIQDIPHGAPASGVITSKFGRRHDPINSKVAFHEGVDIRGKRGTELRATASGTVFETGYDKGYGWYVLIDHGSDFRAMLAHCKKIMVKRGETVARGQVIALLGNSGRSTGPHVHYEIHHKGKLVNPTKFMRIAKYITLDSKE